MDSTFRVPSNNPVALVTGGGRGIGLAICRRLASDGMSVAVNDIDRTSASAAAKEIDEDRGSPHAIAVPGDVGSPSDVRAVVNSTVSVFGRLDVLVNNAAITAIHKPWSAITLEEFVEVQRVNETGPFLCTREAYPHLRESGRGRIINITSTAVLIGAPNMMHYITSKSGLVGMTRALARESGCDSVTVNAVSPGAILTESELEAFGDDPRLTDDLTSVQAIKRRGTPEDIAAVTSFLASEESGFITGQTLNVDGGRFML